ADLAAAALLDTLDAVADSPVAARVVALTGNLDHARRATEICSRLADFVVLQQRGDDFAGRLANAHLDAAAATGGLPILQIGMDTPQVNPELIGRCARALAGNDAVLGMASDGGWWVLGVRHAATADCLRGVPMSAADTGTATLAALQHAGVAVELVSELTDVDTLDDVDLVRRACLPGSRFSRVAAQVSA
ncbi:MAG: DUF2064 domain-containing protein, partial [Actinomycetia bacterium]|nr:DUF2064 domain-containing protein [Actinomycetes bacterium]